MAVPSWLWFIEPVLRELHEAGAPRSRRAVVEAVPKRMRLSEADMAEIAGRGPQTRAAARTGWALSYSGLAGLLHTPARATWAITEKGIELLNRYPAGIPEFELRQIHRSVKQGRRERLADDAGDERIRPSPSEADDDDSDTTPDERLREAYAEIRESVREELLDLIRNGTPEFFETLVLDLQHALGYGTDRTSLEPTPAGADGGIDGVITLDRLGLEKVYVQAKRYAEDHPISRPTIQAFLGALAGRRATKGVFLTTSRFSRDAREFAASASDSLVLVDGAQLAELMMDHGVGVTTRETLTLVSIDGDYFEDA